MTCVALVSDIHGNLPGLEAISADIRRWRPDSVFVLGDMINGACWSGPVLDQIADLGWPMLIGNHDDAVLQLGSARMEPRYADRRHYAALWWTRHSLLPRHLAVLEGLPLERRLTAPDAPPLRLLHGLPGDFFRGVRPDTPEEWAVGRLASVDVRASYIRLRGSPDGWRSETRRVPYHLGAVENGFRDSGLAQEGGVMARMFLRSILSGQPWVADYAWWLRAQPPEVLADVDMAEERYMAAHGPGRWSFPVI
jgi:hypothetical protein